MWRILGCYGFWLCLPNGNYRRLKRGLASVASVAYPEKRIIVVNPIPDLESLFGLPLRKSGDHCARPLKKLQLKTLQGEGGDVFAQPAGYCYLPGL